MNYVFVVSDGTGGTAERALNAAMTQFESTNSHFGNKRVYALGGITYGTRELTGSNSSVSIRNDDSNKSYGLGVEAYQNDAISFQLEWVRYFDNRYYRVDAWNLGLVTRF